MIGHRRGVSGHQHIRLIKSEYDAIKPWSVTVHEGRDLKSSLA